MIPQLTFLENVALHELGGTSKLRTILSLLSYDPTRDLDTSLWIVQRQLIRVVASMVGQVCYNARGGGREQKWCSVLQKGVRVVVAYIHTIQEFVASLLSSLESTSTTPSLLCLELAELLVLSLKETSQHSLVLVEEFMKSGAENILAENLTAIGVSGTRDQQVCTSCRERSHTNQVKFVNVISHLLFTKTSNAEEGSSIQNLGAVAIFFRTIAETNSSDLKSTILFVVSQTFHLATPKEKDILVMEYDMLSILFGQFNEFSVSDRKLVRHIFHLCLTWIRFFRCFLKPFPTPFPQKR